MSMGKIVLGRVVRERDVHEESFDGASLSRLPNYLVSLCSSVELNVSACYIRAKPSRAHHWWGKGIMLGICVGSWGISKEPKRL